jgi:ATP-binding cassette, subfamily F, member 3
VLLEALASYSGTVVFVSHDRYFIDRLATRVLEIEGGAVTAYEGNYEDYLRRKSASAAPAPAEAPVPQHEKPASIGTTFVIEGGFEEFDNAISSPAARGRRLNPIKQKQLQDRCAFLEEEIPRIESAIAHTDEQLGVYVSAAETLRLTTLAEELRRQLAALTAEWEELTAQLEGKTA